MDKQTQQNLLDLVKKSYQQIAEDFAITRQKHLWPELLKLASQVKDGQSVLDVGCGNGRLLKAFQDRRINYVGVDSSEKLIEIAKSKFSIFNFQFSNKSQIQNINFLVGDILELDKIAEKDFDFVFCVAVLHHLPGKDLQIKALEQLKNKIKPGGPPVSAGADKRAGKIIITVWNLWSQKKFRKLILKQALFKLAKIFSLMSRRYGRDPDFALRTSGDFGDILFSWKNSQGEKVSQRYYHAFTKRGLRKIVKIAGLKIDRLDKDKYNYYLVLCSGRDLTSSLEVKSQK